MEVARSELALAPRRRGSPPHPSSACAPLAPQIPVSRHVCVWYMGTHQASAVRGQRRRHGPQSRVELGRKACGIRSSLLPLLLRRRRRRRRRLRGRWLRLQPLDLFLQPLLLTGQERAALLRRLQRSTQSRHPLAQLVDFARARASRCRFRGRSSRYRLGWHAAAVTALSRRRPVFEHVECGRLRRGLGGCQVGLGRWCGLVWRLSRRVLRLQEVTDRARRDPWHVGRASLVPSCARHAPLSAAPGL